MSFIIQQFEIGPMQNFSYLIGDEKTKKALIVDPGWEPDTILKTVTAAGFNLSGMLVSHAHYDHTNAIEELLEKVDVPVYVNHDEVKMAKLGNPIFGSLGRTVHPMKGGDVLDLGKTKIEFLHTPGHTPGSQCFLVGNNLITGDTLFIDGCGRSDLPGGDAGTLLKSLKKLSGLPGDTVICPGHDYGPVKTRVMSEEKKENPYLREI